LTDNWMEFTLRYVVEVKTRRAMRDKLYLRILEEFDRVGDRARIASTTVQLVQPPPLEVRLERPQGD
ncbi:MAG: mechanosensitive ion channel family protein, partial [Prochlorococcaceae cyanobacterium]